jgi:DNA polymerase III epsilon subunit-like protein
MYLFFDTETNGLPANFSAPPSTGNNWPRIIQLAWVLCDENLNPIEHSCDLIKPDGWIIPNEKFWIDNGYSTETNNQNGLPLPFAMAKFIVALQKSKYGIAHNMDFDFPIIASEMMRYDMKSSNKVQKICTMKTATDFCNLKNARGCKKWPKLEELHTILFGESFDGAHDALEDVRATVRCFQQMVKIGLIKL